jgi:hypothetical protein
MSFNRTTALTVAMVMASLGAAGCNRASTPESVDPGVPADTAAPSATTDDAKVTVQGEITVPAPPALKEEAPGVAPSDHHVWSPGYWHYDYVKTVYLWEPGYWQDRVIVAPFAPPPLREEIVEYRYAPAGDYFWAPGYWRWTGASYSWAPGYWAPRMAGYGWVRPYWVSYGGRWECHAWGWERRGPGYAWAHDDWSRPGFSFRDRVEWERRNREGWAHREATEWDRREHDHRVNPATASHPAGMPRREEVSHAYVAAAEHRGPGTTPAAPRAPEPSHAEPARGPTHVEPAHREPPASHAEAPRPGVSPRPEPPHVEPGARPAPAHAPSPIVHPSRSTVAHVTPAQAPAPAAPASRPAAHASVSKGSPKRG